MSWELSGVASASGHQWPVVDCKTHNPHLFDTRDEGHLWALKAIDSLGDMAVVAINHSREGDNLVASTYSGTGEEASMVLTLVNTNK